MIGKELTEGNEELLWKKFEAQILSNNEKLKLLLENNLDLFQENPTKKHSNLEVVYGFITHINEFRCTRLDKEKNRAVLFPEKVNSIFGVMPVSESLLPSTESLEEFIKIMQRQNKLDQVVLGIDNPYISLKSNDKVFLTDTPRIRQLYFDNKCFRKTGIRLESLNFALKYLKSRDINFRYRNSTLLREIIINSVNIVFGYEYCLSKIFLIKMSPEPRSTIVNLHNWNGQSCISKEAYDLAVTFGVTLHEKYKGDALLQKRYTVDFLTKKTKANHGEVPQYYVENDHEAIISPQVFDLAQEEIKKRGRGGKRYSGVSIFSSRIKCGDCGSWYGAKVWHSNDKYRRTIYRCNDKFKHHCKTPYLTEEDIKAIFVKAINKLVGNKDEIISNIQMIREQLCDTANLESEQERLNQDLIALTDMTENCIAKNARVSQDQMEYQEHYNSLVNQYDRAKEQYEVVAAKIKDSRSRNEQLGVFIDNLKGQNLIGEFDKRLWCSLLDSITVYGKDDVQVTFKDGTAIKV